MSKKKRFVKRDQRGDKQKKMSIITFGKPEPVLTKRCRIKRPSASMSLIVSIDSPVSSLYFSIDTEGTVNVIEM